MSSKERLLAFVNASNPGLAQHPLVLERVAVSLPKVDTDDIVSSNTVVTFTHQPGSGYVGEVTVHYRRFPLEEIVQPTTLVSDQPFTPELVIALLNDKRGTHLELSQLEDFEVPALDAAETADVVLTAKADSYEFVGTTRIGLVYGVPENFRTWNDFMAPSS